MVAFRFSSILDAQAMARMLHDAQHQPDPVDQPQDTQPATAHHTSEEQGLSQQPEVMQADCDMHLQRLLEVGCSGWGRLRRPRAVA